jgi:hypothetical protein
MDVLLLSMPYGTPQDGDEVTSLLTLQKVKPLNDGISTRWVTEEPGNDLGELLQTAER